MNKLVSKISVPLLACCAIVGIAGVRPASSEPVDYPGMLHTGEQIEYVKTKLNNEEEPWLSAYGQLLDFAEGQEARNGHAVADFYVPPFYVDSAAHTAAKEGFVGDAYAAYAYALSYVLSGNAAHGARAVHFLNAWAQTNETISAADDTPLVSSYAGGGLLIAADLLMNEPIWSDPDKAGFRAWVNDTYLPAVERIKTRSNNWGDWGTFASTASYYLLGNINRVSSEVERMKERIDSRIAADGHLPQEVRREANGLWYTYFSLAPMTASAQIAYNATGTDLFQWESEQGRTLKSALDYLLYYTEHQEEWPWHPMPPRNPLTMTWPLDLFEAMSTVYGDVYGSAYESFVSPYRPIRGGVKDAVATHAAWNFPTLMKMDPPALPADVKTVIMDNTSAEFVGSWRTSTSRPRYFGVNYAFAETGHGEKTATWRPSLPAAGRYGVYVSLPDGNSERAAAAKFTVYHANGSATYTINQQVQGGQWVLLGRHDFSAGDGGYVVLDNDADSLYVIADAVKFEREDP